MKIIGLLSSPRKNGNTKVLLDAVLNGAKESGADIETIYLADKNIEYCKGCLGCMASGKCPINDDFEWIKNKIMEADGIVIATPTYMGSYNGMLRVLLERLGLFEHMTSAVFGNKYFAVVTTAGGRVGDTIKSLSAQVGVFGRGYFSGGIGLAVKDKKATDYDEIINKCRQLGHKLVDDIRTKKTFPLQNPILRFFTCLLIRPQFKKVIIRNKDKSHKAVYQHLYENNKI